MIKNWKLEITENETKLIIQDGAAMNNDILSLARHLVIKYHLNKLPVYHENGNKYFDYTLKEDTKYKNDNLPIKPFKKVTDSNFSYFLKKAEDLIHESGMLINCMASILYLMCQNDKVILQIAYCALIFSI